MMKTYTKGSMIRKPMMYGGKAKNKMNMGGMTQMSANMPTPMMNKMNMGKGMMYVASVKKK